MAELGLKPKPSYLLYSTWYHPPPSLLASTCTPVLSLAALPVHRAAQGPHTVLSMMILPTG